MNEIDMQRWAEAARIGSSKFKMATPCRNGHLGERYVKSNGACVQCIAQAAARSYKGARVEAHLLDRDHKQLVLDYIQRLNDFTRNKRNVKCTT